jgi:hypothetical protein
MGGIVTFIDQSAINPDWAVGDFRWWFRVRRAYLAGISNRIRHSPVDLPMIVGHTCRRTGPGGPRS